MRTGNVYTEPGWIGMEFQVLKWLVVLKTPQPTPSASFLRKHTSLRQLTAKPRRRICHTIYVCDELEQIRCAAVMWHRPPPT